MKIKFWKGNDLKGVWQVTLKIDGVRALWDGSNWKSRADKLLYNIPEWTPDKAKDCEIYLGSFKETIEAVRTKNTKKQISKEAIFSLDPIDPRLFLGTLTDPSKIEIEHLLKKAISWRYEGLVLRNENTWLKVKPEETFDVPILAFKEGTGKFKGTLGSLLTPKGWVGTGFTDEERAYIWNNQTELLNSIIEVSCMHLTKELRFRHPRFIRFRPDKETG